MPLLSVIPDAPGYLKCTFQGPQGSGKSFTATDLAVTVHKLFKSQKPIAFHDTETGSDFLTRKIKEGTSKDPIRLKSRAFSDLMGVVDECIAGAADVLLIDSISHIWRELQDAYMAKINQELERKHRYPKKRMDIQDVMAIKQQWQPWPDLFVNSPLHIIVCGREGNEWGSEENEETGKRDLVTVGKKMKVEAEFGYEGSLNVAMYVRQVAEGTVKKKGGAKEHRERHLINVAVVIKDRFNVINGQEFEYPTGESFMPHLALLNPSDHRNTDTRTKSQDQMADVGDDGWSMEKKNRTILLEEIQGLITTVYPGQSAKDKLCKAAVVFKSFNTRSWTAVENKESEELKAGLERVRAILSDVASFEAELASGQAA
jgi:hypothetical protein